MSQDLRDSTVASKGMQKLMPTAYRALMAYPMSIKGANGRLFYDMGPGFADGIRCDVEGNVWSSAGWVGEDYDGVHVIAPDGELIGKIHLPEVCANLCFGGAKRNRVFMTASQSLYALYVETQGAQVW